MSRLPAESAAESKMLAAMTKLDEGLAPSELELTALRARLGARAFSPPPAGNLALTVGASTAFGAAATALVLSGSLGTMTGTTTETVPTRVGVAVPTAPMPPPVRAPQGEQEAIAPSSEVTNQTAAAAPEEVIQIADLTPESPTRLSPGEIAEERPSWALVTRALRSGKVGEAERQLNRLAAVATPAERDAVALLRAQLAREHGQTARAAAEFERLSKEAQDPLVKRRAALALHATPAPKDSAP